MKLHGYLVEIDWDGSVLVARGTNADGRELVNAGTDDNRLVLTAADVDEVVFRDAPRMVGGVLRVVDVSGAEHRLHFRRDTRSEFHRLYEELSAAANAARSQRVPKGDPEPTDAVDLTPPARAGSQPWTRRDTAPSPSEPSGPRPESSGHGSVRAP